MVDRGQRLCTQCAAQLAALRRRSVGFVFQDFNLIPALTAIENVTLPLELDGAGRAPAGGAGRAGVVGLADLADRFPDDLSGGQQQRVAIARALVGGRRLILADEPTGALDSETGEPVLRLLRSRVDAGAAGVLVTHEARHAAWADRVVFLRDGRIVDETRRAGAGLAAGVRPMTATLDAPALTGPGARPGDAPPRRRGGRAGVRTSVSRGARSGTRRGRARW